MQTDSDIHHNKSVPLKIGRRVDSNLPVLDRPVLAQQLSANIFLFEKQLQWLGLVELLFAKHWVPRYFN